MKVDVKIILLKDSHGNKASVVYKETCDTVYIVNLKNEKGDPVYFQAEAYHIEGWAKEFDIEIKEIDSSYDFDRLWESV